MTVLGDVFVEVDARKIVATGFESFGVGRQAGVRHEEATTPKYLLFKHYRGGPEPQAQQDIQRSS